ncbi:NAD-binding protein [Ureibacillus sp. Re31]|uniref:NAD-binding protein n=1 Tax=Ureibacillus galli TaxID=2762222 RepID=A0ABR8XFI8_9BACL|nr:3-hydroxyacyl-CoA dehydrogenase NAD-binding domain-containing protein [Ureibacillus galli]MBD8027983.1 NAD-binding protein [Ureibacillus galli]
MKILIIGGGFMGTALATYFNGHGVDVSIYETFEKKRIELMNNEQLSDITILQELCSIEDLDFIIEAIPENLEAKQDLFAKLEHLFPSNVTFCTNTSSYLISEVAKTMEQKSRLIGTHFFSPANISPLVEVVPSEHTDPKRIEAVMVLLKSVKKKPVLLKKEIEGFVANRLQSALSREAMSLVEKGIVSADELDFIAKWSLGIRLANTGPLEQRDINGLDTHLAITKYVYPTLENRTTPLPILEEKCANDSLGIKTKQGFYNWESIDVEDYQSKKNNILNQVIEVVSEGDRNEI